MRDYHGLRPVGSLFLDGAVRADPMTRLVEMPFSEKPEIETPPDDTIVWRYLSFFGFVEMIQQRKIRFTRADKFKDPLEGTFTDAENTVYTSDFANITKLKDIPLAVVVNRLAPVGSFVNCWREGDQESMAMWDLYNRGDGTVAVTSTIGLIKEALAREPQLCSVGKVKYVPWISHRDPEIDPLTICFRKDLSYQHEKEVRAVIHAYDLFGEALGRSREGDKMSDVVARTPSGVDLTVDLSRFITGVVVGPEEHTRSEELIKSIKEHYQLPWVVRASLMLKKR